jgi:UDP-N-acetylglucosamine acyltransferase
MPIHPTAVVDKSARLGEGVDIGPYAIVGPEVSLGPGVAVMSHVVLAGATEIGARTRIHPFASIGGPPQHLGHKGEATRLVVGADCIIREYATVNCGTVAGGGITRLGARVFMMTGAHVGHDCRVGNDVVMANAATLGGHVTVEDFVFLGGLSAIHQFCRIGAYAFVGGCAAVPTDVIPFGSAIGNHAHLAGLNLIGMKRRGVPRDAIHKVRAAYRLLFEEGGAFKDRLERVEAEYGAVAEVRRILDFINADTSRALMAPAR